MKATLALKKCIGISRANRLKLVPNQWPYLEITFVVYVVVKSTSNFTTFHFLSQEDEKKNTFKDKFEKIYLLESRLLFRIVCKRKKLLSSNMSAIEGYNKTKEMRVVWINWTLKRAGVRPASCRKIGLNDWKLRKPGGGTSRKPFWFSCCCMT